MVLTKRNRVIILCAFGGLSAREFRKKVGGDGQEGHVSGEQTGRACLRTDTDRGQGCYA